MKIQEVNCLTGKTIIRDLTNEEKTIQDKHIVEFKKIKDAKTLEKQTKENNKTSAQNKLKALGLTDAEIEAL